MSNYSNPEEHLVKLTPDLRNLGTEGSLDTSILNGVSLQRTMNMIQVESNQGEIKADVKQLTGEVKVIHDVLVAYIADKK
jgi:hypothetical protein